MTDYKAALRRIEKGSINTCPGCGNPNAEWAQPTLVGLPEINGGVISNQGVEAFAYACKSCGYIRLYAAELRG